MINFEKYLADRRSIYVLGKNSPLSNEQLETLVATAVKYVPSPYNMQSQRAVLLLNEPHHKFWHIVETELAKIAPAATFGKTKAKLANFANGVGTILFFDATEVTEDFGNQNPLYRDTFRLWAEHGNAMLQYSLWLELASHGLGASLQHYNPVVDQATKAAFNLPESWKLIAQMPFGEVLAKADPNKPFINQADKFLVKK